MKKTLLFSILLLFASCQNEEQQINSIEVEKNEVSVEDSTNIVETEDLSFNNKMSSDELIEFFKLKKEEISTKLKGLNPEEANKLYLTHRKENGDFTLLLESKNQKLLDEFYFEESQKAIKKLEKKLSDVGLRIVEVGEGYVEINTVPDYYYTIYEDKVTEDFKDYLALTKEEEKKLYAADAGLMISYKEVGDRVISWEKFLKKHPQSALRNEVKDFYAYYQMDYLFGMDNTPTTERAMEGGEAFIYPENILEFERFMSKNPASPTTKLVRIYMAKFKNENIREMMEKERDKIKI